MDAMQDAFGGEFIPAPPLVAIEYSSSPEAMAEKLKALTPELRKGVDVELLFVSSALRVSVFLGGSVAHPLLYPVKESVVGSIE